MTVRFLFPTRDFPLWHGEVHRRPGLVVVRLKEVILHDVDHLVVWVEVIIEDDVFAGRDGGHCRLGRVEIFQLRGNQHHIVHLTHWLHKVLDDMVVVEVLLFLAQRSMTSEVKVVEGKDRAAVGASVEATFADCRKHASRKCVGEGVWGLGDRGHVGTRGWRGWCWDLGLPCLETLLLDRVKGQKSESGRAWVRGKAECEWGEYMAPEYIYLAAGAGQRCQQ